MASYRQSAECPKFGVQPGEGGASQGANYGRDHYPNSFAVYGPQAQPPNLETQTWWSPYGVFDPHPYMGGWDGLGGRLMHVPQADTYFVGANPWPANGVDDQPNAALNVMHLPPTTSAHPGFSIPTGPSPAMIFQAPPIFGVQTVPIPAFGA